jgi:hypothetical protein
MELIKLTKEMLTIAKLQGRPFTFEQCEALGMGEYQDYFWQWAVCEYPVVTQEEYDEFIKRTPPMTEGQKRHQIERLISIAAKKIEKANVDEPKPKSKLKARPLK